MPSRLRFLLPTPAWVRALLAPALVFIATASDRNCQTDFWHHLARGRAMAEQGRLVDHDLFTYTVHGQPFQDNNWLSQLFYYFLYQHGGLALVQLVNSLVLALVIGLVVWQCRRRCGSLAIATAVGVFTFFGLWQLLIIRPQTFSLGLFVLLYVVLEASERRPWLLLVPPLVLALWVNLHGGFPIGLVLIGCFGLAAAVDGFRRQRWGVLGDRYAWALALCLAVSLLATLANPYGIKVYQYVRTTSLTASARHIDEWVPPGLDLLVGKVWVLSVLLVLLLFALPRRRPTVREVCLLLCFLPFACGSVRMVAWWLLIAAPITAALLTENLPRNALTGAPAEGPSLGSAVFLGLLLLGCVGSGLALTDRFAPLVARFRPTHRQEADLEELADRLPSGERGGRIFSRLEWSEYLGWRLEPAGYTVFMDGRIEIYPDTVWGQYAAVTRGRADWEQILDDYGVNYLLLDSTYHSDLLPQVEHSPVWHESSRSGNAILFERRPAQTAQAHLHGAPALRGDQ